MRRLTLWSVSTVSALVLLFSYRTSTGASLEPAVGTPSAPSSTAPSSSSPSAPSSSASSGAGSNGGSASGTYTGSAVDTRWGPVQVRITVEGGKVTDVEAVVYPHENPRDQQINAAALPLLHDEVIEAQSAHIDTISGATVTSDGYLSSLQEALDAAGLG